MQINLIASLKMDKSRYLTVLEELAIDSPDHRIQVNFVWVQAAIDPDYICMMEINDFYWSNWDRAR